MQICSTRFRVGEQTDDDMEKLQTRVRPLNDPDLKDAVYTSCKNKEVEKLNTKMLSELKEKAVIFEAINVHPIIKNFKPPIGNKGNVKDTPFLKTLILKKGARVQLTYNIDTSDCLTNGTCGVVVDFVENVASQIETIMIKFDEEQHGEQKRAAETKLSSLYPGCTSIQRVMFQYSLAKRSKNVANTAKVIQFPLCLCFAATAHKFQGQTVHKPKKTAMDFRTVFQAAQSYVMLSRIQSLSQLYIIGSLPEGKFYASLEALTELERLNCVSINRNPPLWLQVIGNSLKISVLNCHSLADKIIDIQDDPMMKFSDIICLSETWLKLDSFNKNLMLPGYELHLNNMGEGKGIATYFNTEQANISTEIKRPKVQMTKLSTQEIDVINVYRSNGADNKEMINDLKSIIDMDKTTIVAGDFNICFINQRTNPVITFLEDHGFSQLVTQATHLMGGHIDHAYSNHDPNVFDVNILMYSPYYTCQDHDAVFITVRRLSD